MVAPGAGDACQIPALRAQGVGDLNEVEVLGLQVGQLRLGDLPARPGDRALLKQVNANLLDNALKFPRTRAPAVIEAGCREQAGGEPVFYVKDNGAGFDM